MLALREIQEFREAEVMQDNREAREFKEKLAHKVFREFKVQWVQNASALFLLDVVTKLGFLCIVYKIRTFLH